MFKVSKVEVMKFEEVKCFYVFKADVLVYMQSNIFLVDITHTRPQKNFNNTLEFSNSRNDQTGT